MRPIVLILTLLIVQVSTEDLKLTILHNNDMHGRFEETSRNSGTCKEKTTDQNVNENGCVGGFARTAHVIRKFRKSAEAGQGNPVLYLNAGDTYVGTSWFTVHKSKISVDFMNILSPDVMCLGNHEFDFGTKGLAPFIDAAKFPIIAANLDFSDEPNITNVKKSVILEVNNHKIGIVGHLTKDTILLSSPNNVKFSDEVEAVKTECEALSAAGVNIIIVLGHSGYSMDKRIAQEVPLVDIVIGGHTNTFLWNGSPPDAEVPEDVYPKIITQSSGKEVPVVQAYAYTKYIGVLNVTFNDKGDLITYQGQPTFLDTDVPQEQDVLQLLETFRPEIDALDTQVLGTSRVLLDATANKCRLVECNLGNLIADAFVFYMASLNTGSGWTDTPIALVNGGSIRTTIDPSIRGGNITRGELLGTLPFDNQVISLTLTGEELLKTLEIGARSSGETSKGEFLQTSGLHVVYNMSQPPFSRVVSAAARCGNCKVPIYNPIVAEQSYNIVTLSFLVGGGDNHTILQGAANKRVQDLGDVDTVAWYVGKQSPVYPEEQGRIKFLNTTTPPTVSSAGRNVLAPFALLVVVVNKLLTVFEVR